ncbi:MAG: DUF2892 domain-containing protein [Bacteroidetes bacterium]|nr:DUF2892 domain-containing protein [Bacteroidota bacterium]
MKANVGGADKIIRIILGLAIIGVAWFGYHSLWALAGVVVLFTGVFSRCLLYYPFGISSCRKQ